MVTCGAPAVLMKTFVHIFYLGFFVVGCGIADSEILAQQFMNHDPETYSTVYKSS